MKLKKLEVNAFAGISPDSPVILDFTQSKWVNAHGDNGVGKSSLLSALLVACGQLSKDDKNLVNLDSDKIDIDMEFVGKDNRNYAVRCTKSAFKLTYEGQALPEPISKMKSLLGVVGVSPMEIKNAKLQEIIKWLSSYSNKSPEEFEKQAKKLKDGIKSQKESRATANKIVKAMKEYLEAEAMYLNWEESEKKYIKSPDVRELSVALDKTGKDSDKLLKAEEKVKNLKTVQRPFNLNRIEELEEELQTAKNMLAETDKAIEAGEKFVTENKSARTEYDNIKKQYDTAALDVIDFNKWQEIKTKKKDMDEAETLSQKADASEKNLQQDMKTLQAEILPDIKGVELVLEDTHEEGKIKKEGLYWDGKNAAQMSESEFWKLVLEIWRKYKVKVIVIDNYQSLGTMAVEILEKLSKDGAYILTAQMDRQTKELEITYK